MGKDLCDLTLICGSDSCLYSKSRSPEHSTGNLEIENASLQIYCPAVALAFADTAIAKEINRKESINEQYCNCRRLDVSLIFCRQDHEKVCDMYFELDPTMNFCNCVIDWILLDSLCFIHVYREGCLVLVGKGIELDAVCRQFEPYPYHQMRLNAHGAFVVWPGMLFPNPERSWLLKLWRKLALLYRSNQ